MLANFYIPQHFHCTIGVHTVQCQPFFLLINVAEVVVFEQLHFLAHEALHKETIMKRFANHKIWKVLRQEIGKLRIKLRRTFSEAIFLQALLIVAGSSYMYQYDNVILSF